MKRLAPILAIILALMAAAFGQTSQKGRTFNVRDYGAKGDGATSDQTAVAAAVTACTNAGGGVIKFPAGTYLITGISPPGGCDLKGEGRGVSIIYSTTNAVIVNAVQGSGTYLFTGPSIADLTIRGSVTAGSSQIGLKMDDASYYFGSHVERVNIENCGGNGLYNGNVYSSEWDTMFITNCAGYPLLYNSSGLPTNKFRNIYIGDLRATAPTAFRIKAGVFDCDTCNGVNNVVAASRGAAVGTKNGVDGDTTNTGATFLCKNCNFETWVGYGIYAYAGTTIDLDETVFAMDASGSGTGIPIYYENNGDGVDYFAQFVSRGRLTDTVQFANTLSDYANSAPVQAVGFAPLATDGQGPATSSNGRLSTYRNTSTSSNIPLTRKDSQTGITTVTSSTSFTQPGLRYIEANCASACTITLPWTGWFKTSAFVTIKDVSGGAATNNVTVGANSGSTVNGGGSFTINKNGQSVTFVVNATADDWRVVQNDTPSTGVGTVTSVAQSFTGGLISVGGSPITSSGTLALTVAGTSGGIPYFSSASTWASSAALTANMPVIGGGAGVAPAVGTVSGNTTKFVTTTGTLTSGRCAEWDASGNIVQSSGGCGGTPTLTATQVGYGNGSNQLTGDSNLIWDATNKIFTLTSAGTTFLRLAGGSTASAVQVGYNISGTGAIPPGTQGGLLMPFAGGSQSSGPGIFWTNNAYNATSGIWLNLGINYQGATSAHASLKLREPTSTSSDGTVRWQWDPGASSMTATGSVANTGSAFDAETFTYASSGTAAANFGINRLTLLENSTGSQVNASRVGTSWSVATAGAETSSYIISTNLAGGGLGQAFAVTGNQYYGTMTTANITGAATITFNNGNVQQLTLTGNVTSTTLTGVQAGGIYFIDFIQGGVGSFTLASTNIKVTGGSLTLSSAVGAHDLFTCYSNGTNLYCSKALDVK